MSVWLSILLILVCLWIVWSEIKLPAPWSYQVKVHPGWYCRFPDATSDEVRYFLELVIESFVFGSSYQLKLHPDQSLLSIYQTINPIGKVDESLEMESLVMLMEREYGCELSATWDNNLTLAGLFAKVRYVNPVGLNQQTLPIRPSAN